MPTVFTHAVVGAAVSALAPRRFRGLRLAGVLAVVASLPDLDVLAFNFGIPYSHPFGHRGFTHSLTFACLIALAVAPLLCRPVPLLSRAGIGLFLVIFAACASHGFLDAFTDAGLGVGFFIPFDRARYFFPWRPILTSPLSPREFFAGPGMRILEHEAIWVWFPVGILFTLAALARRLGGHGSPNAL